MHFYVEFMNGHLVVAYYAKVEGYITNISGVVSVAELVLQS